MCVYVPRSRIALVPCGHARFSASRAHTFTGRPTGIFCRSPNENGLDSATRQSLATFTLLWGTLRVPVVLVY